MVLLCEFDDLSSDAFGRVTLTECKAVGMQGVKALLVLYEGEGSRYQLLLCRVVFDENCRIFFDESHCIVCLVVFRHIG